MDLRKLKKLIDLVEESGISELEVTEGEERVRIVRDPSTPRLLHRHALPQSAVEAEGRPAPLHERTWVRSPAVGVFYRAATEDAKAFVEEGSRVSAGDPLCALYAVGHLTSVESPCDGIVESICFEQGAAVQFGDALLSIIPEA